MQYNACFWALVLQGGMTPEDAQGTLKVESQVEFHEPKFAVQMGLTDPPVQGTQADFKNELLFSRFGVNYSALPAQHRKGSIVYRQLQMITVKKTDGGAPVVRERMIPVVVHEDLIGERFWQEHPEILA